MNSGVALLRLIESRLGSEVLEQGLKGYESKEIEVPKVLLLLEEMMRASNGLDTTAR